jgi:ribosomal protein S12 methylthiotransferase
MKTIAVKRSAQLKKTEPIVGFVSLGCPKALTDSEQIMTRLRAEGYGVAKDYAGADLVVVNTCGFIDDAVRESLDAIGEALAENGKVIVTGCLGAKTDENGQNVISSIHPKVLAVTGPHAPDEVMAAVHQHLPRKHEPFLDLVPEAGIKLTPRHYAYLKIAEGCNHRCSFCIIPSMRGDLVSRPIGEVQREAHALFKSGVKELLVISQDTSAYGLDTQYKLGFVDGRPVRTRFLEMARELGRLAQDYDAWVRMHYVYPYPHVDHVVDLMAQGLVVPYLDVPFQHASPAVLKAMKRPASGEKNIERIRAWRARCPDITLRSTFIVGFPGETEAQFDELLAFLDEAQLDRVGCFAYSPVTGASANTLADPVPEALKQERRERFMQKQAQISAQRLQRFLGRELTVLVDAVGKEAIIARSVADAPEIDGIVAVEPDKRAKVGEFIRVKINDASDHDLGAVML